MRPVGPAGPRGDPRPPPRSGADLAPSAVSVTPDTEWIFLEALDTLKFPDPWDITDFQYVLDHLKADGCYAFEGEFIEQPPKRKGHPSSLGC